MSGKKLKSSLICLVLYNLLKNWDITLRLNCAVQDISYISKLYENTVSYVERKLHGLHFITLSDFPRDLTMKKLLKQNFMS